jgi:SAM-dependent methyltransferase
LRRSAKSKFTGGVEGSAAVTASVEVKAIENRYQRRRVAGCAGRYSAFDPYVVMAEQEKDRALARLLKSAGIADQITQKSLFEIGCGQGGNLLRFLRFGFRPEKMVANELLPERLEAARPLLPPSIRLIPGDFTTLGFPALSFDVVCLFTVFSSILDDEFQQRMATKAWSMANRGGGVLWYDFIYDNPANPDVRGVTLRRMRELFPHGTFRIQRITLAPPLGRFLSRRWTGFYPLFNCLPVFRTHVLAWIAKNG